MARNRYNVMKKNTVTTDENGEFYYDPLSFPLTSFRVTRPPLEIELSQVDISRIDMLMYRAYGTPQYDDIILWLNNIGILDDVQTGTLLYLPDRRDLERFFLDNQVSD